jgi:hypothetical protein
MISHEFLRFFPDLSIYQTDDGLLLPEVINIGWLSSRVTFTTGNSSSEFTSKLIRLVKESAFSKTKVVMGRWDGTFTCPLCEIDNWTIQTRIPGIGNAELWIPSIFKPGVYYASSTWICHYVLDHQYLPPDEYIQSVMLFDENKIINADIIAFDLRTKYQFIADGKAINHDYVERMHKFLDK